MCPTPPQQRLSHLTEDNAEQMTRGRRTFIQGLTESGELVRKNLVGCYQKRFENSKGDKLASLNVQKSCGHSYCFVRLHPCSCRYMLLLTSFKEALSMPLVV